MPDLTPARRRHDPAPRREAILAYLLENDSLVNESNTATVMSHEHFNQGSGDMLCYFLGHSTRNYSEKKAFRDIYARN